MTQLNRRQIAKLWFTFSETYDSQKALRLLVQLIFEQKRQREISSIIQTIRRLEFERTGTATVFITTARPIEASIEQEIGNLMKKLTHAKTVQLHLTVDPKIVGGFVAQADDMVVDASIRRSLVSLETL